MNLVEGILEQRDRLASIKSAVGEDIDRPEFFFWKASINSLIDRATEALIGKIDVVEMIELIKEMKEFEA